MYSEVTKETFQNIHVRPGAIVSEVNFFNGINWNLFQFMPEILLH